MAVPKKYADIDLQPPGDVAEQAEKGLRLRREHGRGGTPVGIARARDLKNRQPVSPQTVRRMDAYFARHAVDKKASNFGDDDDPSAGYVAWLLWGGDAGRDWAQRIKRRMDEVDA